MPFQPAFPAVRSDSPAGSDDEVYRVFCVDDDPVAQRLAVQALARTGWVVECACHGEEALARFTSDPRGFDLLMTDHLMPHLDGLGLVKALREHGFNGPVIVASGHLDAAVRRAYQALRVQRLIAKPLGVAALRAATDALLLRTAASRAPRLAPARAHRPQLTQVMHR